MKTSPRLEMFWKHLLPNQVLGCVPHVQVDALFPLLQLAQCWSWCWPWGWPWGWTWRWTWRWTQEKTSKPRRRWPWRGSWEWSQWWSRCQPWWQQLWMGTSCLFAGQHESFRGDSKFCIFYFFTEIQLRSKSQNKTLYICWPQVQEDGKNYHSTALKFPDSFAKPSKITQTVFGLSEKNNFFKISIWTRKAWTYWARSWNRNWFPRLGCIGGSIPSQSHY